MSLADFTHSQLYKRKSINLTKVGFDFDADASIEYERVKSRLSSLYLVRGESMLSMMKLYGIPSSKTMDTLFKLFDITARSLSEANTLALSTGRATPIEKNGFRSKQKWHCTWDKKKVFLRSTYEERVALFLDDARVHYETEAMRVSYFDTTKNCYRICIPDFYLPDAKTIIEVKATYWYDKSEMDDKFRRYKELGFFPILVLDDVNLVEVLGFEPRSYTLKG